MQQQYTTQHNQTTTHDIIIGPYVTSDITGHYNTLYQCSVTFLVDFSAIMYNTTSSGLLLTNIWLPTIIMLMYLVRKFEGKYMSMRVFKTICIFFQNPLHEI